MYFFSFLRGICLSPTVRQPLGLIALYTLYLKWLSESECLSSNLMTVFSINQDLSIMIFTRLNKNKRTAVLSLFYAVLSSFYLFYKHCILFNFNNRYNYLLNM